LDQKLVSPAVEGVETFGVVDVVDEHAAVGTTVESNTERLESFLTSGIPELATASDGQGFTGFVKEWSTHLHGD